MTGRNSLYSITSSAFSSASAMICAGREGEAIRAHLPLHTILTRTLSLRRAYYLADDLGAEVEVGVVQHLSELTAVEVPAAVRVGGEEQLCKEGSPCGGVWPCVHDSCATYPSPSEHGMMRPDD